MKNYHILAVFCLVFVSSIYRQVHHLGRVPQAQAQAPSCLESQSAMIGLPRKIYDNQDFDSIPLSLTKELEGKIKDSTLVKKLSGRLDHLRNFNSGTHIHMAAMEFGALTLNAKTITAKVGGMAVVVNDMIKLFPEFLKKRGGAKLSFSFMAFDGVPLELENLYKTFDIKMGDRIERVRVYRYQHDDGADLYFLDHPIFKRRSLKNGNLYEPELPQWAQRYSGRDDYEEVFSYALFNKAIAKVHQDIDATAYHAHDFHTGLAGFYLDPNESTFSLTIHNAGQGYHGSEFFDGKYKQKKPHPNFPYGVPDGDTGDLDYYLKLLGLDENPYHAFEKFMNYFEHDGSFNTLKGVLRYFEEHNGISGIPVSQGYEKELRLSREEMLDLIRQQKNGSGALDENALVTFNDNIDMGNIFGNENGLGFDKHASEHSFLKQKTQEQLGSIHERIPDHMRKIWLKEGGLQFGQDLSSEKGKKSVHETKDQLKEMLQEVAGLEKTADRPLFTLVSRLVDQKNVDVLADNIKRIVHQGGQVVIGGQAGDATGKAVVEKLLHLEAELGHSNPGQFRFFHEFVNKELGVLLQAGGDFFVLTSKFEPCGLTDIEAAWLGSIIVSKRVGGLGKVKAGLYYDVMDTTDYDHEVQALGNLLDEAVDLFKNKKDEFLSRRIRGMGEDFSWDIGLSIYFESYRVSQIFKIIKTIEQEGVHKNHLTWEEAISISKKLIDSLPADSQMVLKQMLGARRYPGDLESQLIQTGPY